jgi:3-hydroxyacyl-CoA dehydrogenase
MGSQIAAHLAGVGLSVELLDLRSEEGPANAVAATALAAASKLNPNPFFTKDVTERIRVGNFDDHLDRLAHVDWIIEVVIERLDIKRALLARVEEVARDDAVISTNTSGLPIHKLAAERSDDFKRRFLGTHFFNPPRYLRLFEVIPTPETDPAVLERVCHFGRVHLGKGVVVAKDTPNFIGNRIGIYAALQAIRQVTENEYTIEEVDLLTGRLVGHAKSATFRTADLVGLDTLQHVAKNLHEAVEQDESREAFRPPWLLAKLVERGSLGAKTKEGFYKKVDGKILSIDPESMEYTSGHGKKLGEVDELRKIKPLAKRLKALYDDKGRAGEFFRATTLELLLYAARRMPEIADEVIDIDRAVRLGFGWELGPFEIWDAVGFQRVHADLTEASAKLPEWVDAMAASGATGFYQQEDGGTAGWSPATTTHVMRPRQHDELELARIASDETKVVWSNEESAVLDLGDGVALFEFRSKMNSLGAAVIQGLHHAITLVEEGPWQGLVIGNASDNFTVGANLYEVAMAAMAGHWDEIDSAVVNFQNASRRIRYATKPVIVSTIGRALGGGCEFSMWCPNPVVAAESYIGLVEIAAGLIPAGGGTTAMAAWAADQAVSDSPEHIAPHLRAAFETVAKAQVALSAHEAIELGFLSPSTTIVMNPDRRLWVAKRRVLELAAAGYRPPAIRAAIPVLGRPGRGMFDVGVQHLVAGGWVGEYDAFVARRIGWVITGGDLIGPAKLHEDRMLELEREVFLSLLGEKQTQQKIADLVMRNQPKAAKMVAKGLVSISNVFRRKPKKKPE